MNNAMRSLMMLSALSVGLMCACERRPLEEEFHETALVQVKIDWSRSGINVTNERVTDEVHRVSIRFFPKDGSPVFDHYLDTDVTEGMIEVPKGNYSVVVFNESIYDEEYWGERIRFAGVNSYADFSASLVPHDDALRAEQFPYYKPVYGDKPILEPLPLASWSLDNFEVTREMIIGSRAGAQDTADDTRAGDDRDALTKVVMRCLTPRVNVEARVKNLVSSYFNHCAKRGFSSTVYMASGKTAGASTYLFALNGRRYDEDRLSGITRATFLSMGRMSTNESYKLAVDSYLVNDELHTARTPLLFDVTDQVKASTDTEINISIGYELPCVKGGIAVDEWDDNEIDLE